MKNEYILSVGILIVIDFVLISFIGEAGVEIVISVFLLIIVLRLMDKENGTYSYINKPDLRTRRINNADVGELIKFLRKSNGYSQETFAEKMNVSSKTVRNWEKGVVLPNMEDVMTITDIFNISLEELYNGKLHVSEKEDVGLNDKTNH